MGYTAQEPEDLLISVILQYRLGDTLPECVFRVKVNRKQVLMICPSKNHQVWTGTLSSLSQTANPKLTVMRCGVIFWEAKFLPGCYSNPMY